MNIPAFIDLGEVEQLTELRSFLAEKGADISEDVISEEGLVDDVLEILQASDVIFKDNPSLEDVEGVFNSIVSIVLIIPLEQCDEIVRIFCEKLSTSSPEDVTALAKVRVLSNLFNGLHERSPLRFDIYSTLVKVAGQADLIDIVSHDLEQIKKWVAMWDISTQRVQALLRSLHEALVECKHIEKATKVMIELLSTYTEDNASQARDDAHRCIVTHLADPKTFILDHLLTLKPVKFLEGEPIHDLLTIFVSGRLQQYLQFHNSHKDYISSIGLSHEDNMCKMRVLTMMTIAETKKEVDFDLVMREMKLEADEVEPFIIELVRTKMVRAKIDGINRRILISATTHRTFGKMQWQLLREQLGTWQHNLSHVLSSLQTLLIHTAPATDAQ